MDENSALLTGVARAAFILVLVCQLFLSWKPVFMRVYLPLVLLCTASHRHILLCTYAV